MTKSAKRKAHDARPKPVPVPKAQRLGVSVLDKLPRVPLAPPYGPVLVDKIDLAFPASVIALMPDARDIPEAYKRDRGTYDDLFNAWFYSGLTKFEPVLRDPTMNMTACLGHISCVMRSYEPSHGHKEATVRFLVDTWFSEVVWEAK